MAGGSTGQSRPADIHLNASRSEQTLIALWVAGYGERLRGLGDPFQVVFDSDGVRLHEMGVSIDPDIATDWRAFIPWSQVERVGLASVSLPDPGGRSQILRDAITITAASVTIPLLAYSPAMGLAGLLNGRSVNMVQVAQTVNVLRGRPDARVNPTDLMRETVPELDRVRQKLSADPDRPSRSVDELLVDIVRREPVYGTPSATIRERWRRVQAVAGALLAIGIALIIGSTMADLDWLRGTGLVVAMANGVAITIATGRSSATEKLALTELEAGYTLSSSGPVQVDQLDPATSIVIRRAGERALTPVEERKARSAARLLDAGGPELPPSEWALLRARQILSGGEDPEVVPATALPERTTAAPGAPAWGTGSGEPVPARHALLAGRHSRSITWYRRRDLLQRREAEQSAGYTLSRTDRPDLDQVDPVTGYVIRPASKPPLTRQQERAAIARVRMLPAAGR